MVAGYLDHLFEFQTMAKKKTPAKKTPIKNR
jgi:hypothetical protein